MSSPAANLRGIVFMVLATGFFACNDALMKLATVGLPPFEVLFLRGFWASLLALPVVLLTGNGPQLRHIANRWVVLRNIFELLAVLCFVVALANMPVADLTALGQISPMLLLLGVAVLYRDKIGVPHGVDRDRLCRCAAGGAAGRQWRVAVRDPGALTAVGTAVRDIIGRKVDPKIPMLVVAYGTLVLVMIGAGVATLLFEHWVMPDGAASAAARVLRTAAEPRAFLHFPELPHRRDRGGGAVLLQSSRSGRCARLSSCSARCPIRSRCAGIVLIVGSGVAVVLVDAGRRKPMQVEVPVA